MASIRQVAREWIDEARGGIAWIAVWKNGKSWNGYAYYPGDVSREGNPTYGAEDKAELEEIANADANAIIVNAYWHNLGSVEDMTSQSLANALRWQYEEARANLVTENIK